MVRTLKNNWWVMGLVITALALISTTMAMAIQSHSLDAGRAVYVSPSGNDTNPGTQSQPIQTLQHARDLVRTINQTMNGDITFFLEEGTYRLSQTLSLKSSDSGTNGHNIIWSAAPGAHPVLSGAVKINSWTPFDAIKNIWVAQAPKGLKTRQRQ